MNSMQITFKTLYTELMSVHDQIQLKSKVKLVEVHDTLPLMAFSDVDGNIMIFDIIERKPIRAFSVAQYLPEQTSIKDLKFFDTNEKNYIINADLNEIKKIKGLPFNKRSSLLILTLEKSVCFYSYLTNNFIKMITMNDLEQRLPIKSELLNYRFLVILTSDGSLIIWNILDWDIHKIFNKVNLGRTASNFGVISTSNEEKFIAVALSSGHLLMIDMNKKDGAIIKLEERNEHEAHVMSLDFNPITNILCTVSKNAIYLVDIKNIKNNKKIPNFQYFKSEKVCGIIANLNNNYSKNNYFIYGKTSAITTMDLPLDIIKNKKIDTKDAKNYISSNFDMDTQNINKAADNKQYKIYTAKMLIHAVDFMVLGTNKGAVILKFNMLTKPDISSCNLLNSINERLLYFYSISNGTTLSEHRQYIKQNMEKLPELKTKILINQVFDNKALVANSLNRYKINFSYDGIYMSTVDIVNNIYTIFYLSITENLNYNCKAIKYGKCAGEIEWCPYDNIYAITLGTISQVSTKSHLASDKNRLSNYFKMGFSLNVFKIQGESITAMYVIDDLPCHRLFGGHYIGIMTNHVNSGSSGNSSAGEDFIFPGSFSKFSYNESATHYVLNFYNWTEKIKLDIFISEEPKFILSSSDLQFMIIFYVTKYVIYQVACGEEHFSMTPVNIYYHQVVDAYIYENFVLIFITDKGFYFQFLNEENSHPYKFFKLSDEFNMFNLKVSRKLKEKVTIYKKKPFPMKILGVFENNLIYSTAFNQICSKPIDNIMFKIIDLITKRKYEEISSLLVDLDKKYIKSVFAIFQYYFDNNEEILRKIFAMLGSEVIENFELFKFNNMFVDDLFKSMGKEKEVNTKNDRCIKGFLVKYISSKNEEGIRNLYKMANQSEKAAILCSKFVDPKTFLETMIKSNKNFESYLFNENYKIHEGEGEKILSYAFQRKNTVYNK